ncbi:neuroligin-4, X-linked-like [Uloborus diversus]|uniref:neuroligin-4, X-linked-like n=1 Tax=Uloborus diversus TaxID=327109 RepID=UPI0024090376|nr:neuroligin-4, X-linked-like [Uloborus diversus]
MVFIHGESYEWNAGNPYDGRVLASYGNVVVVTINYRLGVLGFLPAVDKSARGNYGLMDQVAALHWIQENIEEFGGDASNVTIFGHGYGAACVNLLMLSPMAKGLFHRAIMQSGSALSPWAIAHEAITHTHHIAEALDCPAQDNTALVECLRKRELQEIMDVEIPVPDYLSAFGPTVDGIVLPQDPEVMMERSPELYTQYDLLFGSTKIESYFQFSALEETFGIESSRRDRILRTLVRNLFTYHLQEIFLTIVNEYMDWSKPFLHASNIFENTVDALGDAVVVAPIIRAGSFHSGGLLRDYSYPFQSSSTTAAEKRSYFYVFTYQTEYGDFTSKVGCITGEDLPYVFGAPLVTSLAHFGNNYTKAEVSLSEVIMTQWTNFAKYGNPNIVTPDSETQSENLRGRYEKANWPAYEPIHQKYLSITMKPKVRDHYKAHRLSYWLNLIPRLHSSGEMNVSVQHHRLQDHDNPSSYDGIVRSFPGSRGPFPSTLPPPPSLEGSSNDHQNESFRDENMTAKTEAKETEFISKLDRGNSSLSTSGNQRMYSTALIVTIAVGCSLLILNVIIFAGIYYQKEKDNLEKKLQKTFYQERRSDDEEGHPSGGKPFLVKDLSSSMMLNQYCSQQEYDGRQALDLVQPSKVKQQYQQSLSSANSHESCDGQFHMSSRTPQSERGIGLREAQPLLTPPSSNPHTIIATADCLQSWQHNQEMSVFGIDAHT